VRSSHMYVGPEVQAVTIRRQVPPNLCMQPTAMCFRRSALRAPISLSPSAPPSRPLHAASDTVVGHQVPPITFYLVQGCPTPAERSGRAAFTCIGQSLFTAVLHGGSGHVPLHAEMAARVVELRVPATASAARAAAPVIVAAACAG
jgi:hypothetical protein